MDMAASAAESVLNKLEEMRKELQELRLQQEFGLQRFAGSDADIRFYTRFASYDHLMAFWSLIEPCLYKMIEPCLQSQISCPEKIRSGRTCTCINETAAPAHR